MSRRAALSPKAMARMGWTRATPASAGKLRSLWVHRSGWTLAHCGHPTALWPYDLKDPNGERVLAGVRVGFPRDHGTAWPDVRSAAEWLALHLASEAAPPARPVAVPIRPTPAAGPQLALF